MAADFRRQPRLMFAKSVASLALALACALAAASPAYAADPYELNVILPLTGGGTFVGQEESGALMALQDSVNKSGGIKGRPLKFVLSDDQTSPQVALQIANGLIAKHVPIILGSSLVAACSAIAPLAKDGPLVYCMSPGYHPEDGSYVFSSNVSTRDLTTATIRWLRERGLKTIALFTSTDASGQDAEKSFQTTFALPENRDIKLVDSEHFNPTDVSVSAQMVKVKAADPQVLIAWTSGTPLGTLLRGANEAGISVPILTTTANATYAQMSQYASFLPKDLLFPGIASLAQNAVKDGATLKAIDVYTKALAANKLRPTYLATTAWDPALILVEALRKIGPDATAQQVRTYISGLKGFVGVNGPYDFAKNPQRGLGLDAAYVVRWDAAKASWVGESGAAGSPLRGSK
jgi:branched-chain amino acid transport system substrate-binding protein